MEQHERDFFVYRIICGYLRYKVSQDVELFIYEPDKDIIYESELLYLDVYHESILSGLMSEDDNLDYLESVDMWTYYNEQRLENISKDIDDLKLDLYNNFYDDMRRLIIKQEISNLRLEQAELYSRKHQYDYYTAKGVATFAKNYFIAENTTFLKSKKEYNWEEITPLAILSFKDKNSISDIQVRELAKIDSWRITWQAAKKNGGLFSKSGSELTDEQKRLIFWSSFYDSVYEHPECPIDAIVEDDDALDGWIICQKRERDKEKGTREVEKKINPRMKNAHEIFVIARDDKHAESINNMNGSLGKYTKIARTNQILKNGEVKDFEFADVKQRIIMEGIQKGNAIALKGGR